MKEYTQEQIFIARNDCNLSIRQVAEKLHLTTQEVRDIYNALNGEDLQNIYTKYGRELDLEELGKKRTPETEQLMNRICKVIGDGKLTAWQIATALNEKQAKIRTVLKILIYEGSLRKEQLPTKPEDVGGNKRVKQVNYYSLFE